MRALAVVGFAWTTVLVATVGGLSAEGLPQPPAGATEIGTRPVAWCDEASGVYERAWDLNPATEAALAHYGRFDVLGTAAPSLGPPVAAVRQDDAGAMTFYVLTQTGAVETLSREVMKLRWPGGWCEIPGIARRQT